MAHTKAQHCESFKVYHALVVRQLTKTARSSSLEDAVYLSAHLMHRCTDAQMYSAGCTNWLMLWL